MNYKQDNWVDLLPYAEYAYNSKAHAAHGQSPIRVAFGLNPKGFDSVPDEHWLRKPPAVWDKDAAAPELRRQVSGHITQWHELWEAAKAALEYAQRSNAKWYNTKRSDRHFHEGELVLLRAKNITTSRPSKKFDARYLGPFTITKRIGKLAYRLDLPPSMARIHPVFNVSLLEPWTPPAPEKGFRPGPVAIPEDVLPGDRYEVEGILEHKDTASRGREYRVKWLGWSLEDSTWESADHLDHCDELLEDYLQNPRDVSRGTGGNRQDRRRGVNAPKPRGRPKKAAVEGRKG